jgi:K+-transporting ATPase KdpF subunit
MKISILIEISNIIRPIPYTGYLIGAIIAALILGYLLYTLVKPEKF